MILLLTNDDGIDAPGIAALEAAADPLGEVWVVAPIEGHSGCGHRVTTHEPLRFRQVGPRRFAVAGTPADCVRLAVHGLTPRPDWVLAGINAGGNLGADVYHSGTVAAVREAALHGWPGLAVSQYRRRDRDFDWPRASRWVGRILPDLLVAPMGRGSFWNMNLPHLDDNTPDPQTVRCPLDVSPLPLLFREGPDGWIYAGDYHGRQRVPGADVATCFGGAIALSLLGVDQACR
jgi:5'-nucleotidase